MQLGARRASSYPAQNRKIRKPVDYKTQNDRRTMLTRNKTLNIQILTVGFLDWEKKLI